MVEKNIALLFSGQGAQFPGMGKDLFEKYAKVQELFNLASQVCGKDMKTLLFEADAEELKKTENTQVAITLVNLAVREALLEEGISSQACAGFSLGEFSAMVDAGILSKEDAFTLVSKRGEIMAEASDQAISSFGPVGMGAVMGLNFEDVSRILSESSIENVFAANNNSPVQVVISGTSEGIKQAGEALKEGGARRVIPLKVSGPFHTPLLESGVQALQEAIERADFKAPIKSFYSNVTGNIATSVDEVKKLSIAQMISPVQWLKTEGYIGSSSIDFCIEAGPGSVLTGLWKKSGMEQPCFAGGTVDGIDQIIESLRV